VKCNKRRKVQDIRKTFFGRGIRRQKIEYRKIYKEPHKQLRLKNPPACVQDVKI
jgi:hypothetical protein